MELQERLYSCGPAAVRSALYVLGHKTSEAAIRRQAGTTPDGTDERGIIRAIHHYGHKTREHHTEAIKVAWDWLKTELRRGRPVLLCVDKWDHWVSAIGTLGSKVLIFDPDSSMGQKRKYSGIKLYSEHELGSRWKYMGEGRGCYYSISVVPY